MILCERPKSQLSSQLPERCSADAGDPGCQRYRVYYAKVIEKELLAKRNLSAAERRRIRILRLRHRLISVDETIGTLFLPPGEICQSRPAKGRCISGGDSLVSNTTAAYQKYQALSLHLGNQPTWSSRTLNPTCHKAVHRWPFLMNSLEQQIMHWSWRV